MWWTCGRDATATQTVLFVRFKFKSPHLSYSKSTIWRSEHKHVCVCSLLLGMMPIITFRVCTGGLPKHLCCSSHFMPLDQGLNWSRILVTFSIDVYIIKAPYLLPHLCLIVYGWLHNTGNKLIYYIRYLLCLSNVLWWDNNKHGAEVASIIITRPCACIQWIISP